MIVIPFTKFKISRLSGNVFLIITFFSLDKVLAFVRAGIISRQYRDSVALLDTFNAANNLPDALFALISAGALSMAFIPLLTEYLTQKDRSAAWDLFSRVANLAFLVTGGLAVVIAIFAQPIADRVIVPGFPLDQRILLAELMRLNLVSTIIFSVSGLVSASLQANQHFLSPALAPIAYNVGQILGALFLVPYYGIQGLVYGVILGALFHLLIQLPALVKFGFRWTPALELRHTGLVEALRLLWPRLLTMGAIQLPMILRDNFASQLGQEGAVTALTNGWMLMQVPETIIGTAIATAMLPTLAELAARQDWVEFRDTIERALRVLIVLMLPAATVMAAGLHPWVQVVFGFDEAQSALITWTTRAYLLTLTGYAIQEVATRTFYARKLPLYPLATVVLRVVLYTLIGFSAVRFFKQMGAPVIAFADIALFAESLVLFWLLIRQIQKPLRVWDAILRGLVAALVGGATAYGLAGFLPGPGYITALAGMAAGAVIAIVIVWKDARLVFRL